MDALALLAAFFVDAREAGLAALRAPPCFAAGLVATAFFCTAAFEADFLALAEALSDVRLVPLAAPAIPECSANSAAKAAMRTLSFMMAGCESGTAGALLRFGLKISRYKKDFKSFRRTA
ncbi:hypothetical protein AAG895_15810 [Thauera sp. JM12B12]|uniref:hypothetical protein n=1 Tax=Thauera sp. JM12B12 TaxID=3142262 RepID=UPI0031F3DC8D